MRHGITYVAVRVFLALLLAITAAGCASRRRAGPGLEGEDSPLRRPATPGARVVDISVPREEYTRRLAMGSAANKARLIEIFSRESRGEYPEYRLFDVQPDSVYQMLGLQSADILISAEEVAFLSPDKFAGYVTLLPQLDQGQIEVRRGGSPVILKYTMTGMKQPAVVIEAEKTRG